MHGKNFELTTKPFGLFLNSLHMEHWQEEIRVIYGKGSLDSGL